jgi:predicted nucleotidyltransferase
MVEPSEIEAVLARVLSARGDVRLAVVFGSVARGGASEASDVDVAVYAPGVDLLELAATLAEALVREVDVIALEGAGYPLLLEIVREGVVVHEGRPGAAASWRARALATLETDRPWFERMRDAWLRRVAAGGVRTW